MMFNSIFWIKRTQFSARAHAIHYFIAAGCLIFCVPLSWHNVICGTKFMGMNFASFILHLSLSQMVGLTGLHNMLSLGVHISWMIPNIIRNYKTKFTPYCQWDAIASCVLPFLLMLALGYANQEAKLEEDRKLHKKCNDVTNIINSLSTGITITKNIYGSN